MTVRTSAGSTIGITATPPATFDAAGYAAGVFTLIGEITNIGEFGRVYALVTHQPLASRGTQKKKGSFNEGQLALGLALDELDAGQVLVNTALTSDADFYFCITVQNGDKYFFPAQVMGFPKNPGSVDNIFSATISLEITTAANGSGIIRKAAA